MGPAASSHTARRRLEARPDLLKLGASSAVWAVLDKVVDDYIPVADAIEDDIEEVEKDVFDDDIPAPTGPHLQPEARGDRVPPGGLAAARPARDPRAGRFRARPRRAAPATSATSPTTPSGSTSRSALSGSSSPASCRRTSRWSASTRTRSSRGSRRSRNHRGADLHRLGLRHELRQHARAALAFRLRATALALMAICVVALVAFFRRIDWL